MMEFIVVVPTGFVSQRGARGGGVRDARLGAASERARRCAGGGAMHGGGGGWAWRRRCAVRRRAATRAVALRWRWEARGRWRKARVQLHCNGRCALTGVVACDCFAMRTARREGGHDRDGGEVASNIS